MVRVLYGMSVYELKLKDSSGGRRETPRTVDKRLNLSKTTKNQPRSSAFLLDAGNRSHVRMPTCTSHDLPQLYYTAQLLNNIGPN